MNLYPFQQDGVRWLQDHPFGHLGDEMGLGKTGQAVAASDSLGDRLTLVICPAGLKLNWRDEIRKWNTLDRPVYIVNGGDWPKVGRVGWVIINYDILRKHEKVLRATPWDTVILDEAHYIKSVDSERSRQVLGKSAKMDGGPLPRLHASRRWTLSGTPILNRPSELWTLWYWLDQHGCPSYWGYMKEHAGASQANQWNCAGAARITELANKIKPWMLRRKKADVLTELPPKTRQIIEIEPDAEGQAIVRREHEIIASESVFRDHFADLRPGYPDWDRISLVRHDTARAKVRPAVEHIAHLLDEVGKVVVFAYHRDVIECLTTQAMNGATCIHGDINMDERYRRIAKFQTDPECRVIVGQITAMGQGINLTAASTVLFVEESWVPGEITQAEDRCHRIGQRENVLVQHLVLADSLDAYMARVLVEKQNMIDRILD